MGKVIDINLTLQLFLFSLFLNPSMNSLTTSQLTHFHLLSIIQLFCRKVFGYFLGHLVWVGLFKYCENGKGEFSVMRVAKKSRCTYIGKVIASSAFNLAWYHMYHLVAWNTIKNLRIFVFHKINLYAHAILKHKIIFCIKA